MYLMRGCLLHFIAWGALLIFCILCWLDLIFFVLQDAAICLGLWQEKHVIFFIGGKNLLWHLPNLFNSTLGAYKPLAVDFFILSFYVLSCYCLILFVSLRIMFLLASSSVGIFWAASLSFTTFTKIIFLLSSTLVLLVSPS